MTAEAGLTAHEDDQSQTQRSLIYPRFDANKACGPPGHGKGGSSKGWPAGSDHEEMPQFMRWSVLVDAELGQLGKEVRDHLIRRGKEEFDCIVSWRADRHSDNSLSIPFRVSVRGSCAQECMEWLIEALCTKYADTVDLTDIWSTPVPQEDHFLKVQHTLEQTIVKTFPPSDTDIQSGEGARLVPRAAPEVGSVVVVPGGSSYIQKALRGRHGLRIFRFYQICNSSGRLDPQCLSVLVQWY